MDPNGAAGIPSLITERERTCAEFASIAGCDLAVAQCYLAENDWELERAINSYFEPGVESLPKEEPLSIVTKPSTSETMSVTDTCIDLTDDSPVVIKQAPVVDNPTTLNQEDESHITLLTWNVDGIDQSNLPERARGVCSYLALYSPDVIFLQEVIPLYYDYLKKRAISYTIITGEEDGYFTAIMLKKSRVKLISQEIVPFPSTVMMRNLLVVNVNICGHNICLMTSHLESTKEHSNERVNQLRIVLKKIEEVPPSTTVIFGGDTNLRDSEVDKIGGLPSTILDIWEFLGKPERCRYTWDTKLNNNLKARYTCRLRFDRIFYRAAEDGSQVVPQSLDLVGTEKLDCGRFPSDHWGLFCDFDVIL
ncbi:tyrosyl-DNA phosphodiesterase 2 isoform X1 [Bufo bufo]|uniref:tyrosyl-DNA phosphodiesterase 2 isoform X1 n=1 Tax=Bufo bufo TaxID=8384 RepID=UPI001ABE9B1F|nr:tyrosyl-DNA phosphodiesterase 2 isoform X1 [Bufo bufo]